MKTLRLTLCTAVALAALPAAVSAQTVTASPTNFGTDQKSRDGKPGVQYQGNGEQVTAHGRHRLPPGYHDAPSVEFKHGPDPDHEANIQRDSVTGTDLSHFGSAYAGSSPVATGELGDTNGNGWVAPRQ